MCWILPMLIWLPIWFEKGINGEAIEYRTAHGNEDGRICYAYDDDKMTLLTHLQHIMLLVTDIFVFSCIFICFGIFLWQLKKNTDTGKENETNPNHNPFLHMKEILIAKSKKRSLSKAMGVIALAYVLFRMPLFVIGTKIDSESGDFDWSFRIASIFYDAKYTIMPFLLCFINKNVRRAYMDIIKLFQSPCCTKEEI